MSNFQLNKVFFYCTAKMEIFLIKFASIFGFFSQSKLNFNVIFRAFIFQMGFYLMRLIAVARRTAGFSNALSQQKQFCSVSTNKWLPHCWMCRIFGFRYGNVNKSGLIQINGRPNLLWFNLVRIDRSIEFYDLVKLVLEYVKNRHNNRVDFNQSSSNESS